MAEELQEPVVEPADLRVAGPETARWDVDVLSDSETATLEALHDVTRALVGAGDRAEVCQLAVAAARDVLQLPLSGIHVVSNDRLVPVAVTDEIVDIYGAVPSFAPGDHPTWQAYEDGEPVVIGDHEEYRSVESPRPPSESGVLAPLGEHGVFLMNTPEERQLTDAELSFALTLAANTKSALDVATREAELERQKERLETFTAMLSHDLRNPLMMLQGNLDLARETGEAAHFEKVEEAADRMDELIDHVLTLARSGETVEDPDWLDPETVVLQAWGELSERTELQVELPDAVRIAADPDRLRQLLVNLLRNAVEHGSSSAHSGAHEDASGHVADAPTVTVGLEGDTLFVADDGPGIPESERKQVFEYGYTGDDGGSGLGLRIVAELAEAHGWSVAATESEAGGARIEICGVDTRDISG